MKFNDDIYIKCLKRVDSDGLLLHSTGPDFSDFFVENSEVRRIFNVVGVVSPLRAYIC
jgi:phage repressor protein C with HTH and peptisase S24 domain